MHSSRFDFTSVKNFSSVPITIGQDRFEERPGGRAGAYEDERQDAISGVVTIRTTEPESIL